MQKYLMTCGAVLALGLLAASCSRDTDYRGISEDEKLQNAEQHLGITIDPNQDWNNFQNVTATVKINGEWGETYTVKVYENNPFINGNEATILGSTTVGQNGTATIDVTTGKGATVLFAAIVDAKGYTYLKPMVINEGTATATFSAIGAANAARTRTATNSHVNIPNADRQAAIDLAAEILAKSVEVTNDNQNSTYFNYWYGYEQSDYWYNPDHSYAQEPKPGVEPSWHASNANYVTNFLVSGTWEGNIGRVGLASFEYVGSTTNYDEAYTDPYGNKYWNSDYKVGCLIKMVPTTVYIADGGKWIINGTQTAGQGATEDFVDVIIIVGDGGELQVNGTLNMANLGRLIVLDGGKVTGTGTVQVNNGSKDGQESINMGEISVATFNENFGRFYNYGTITSNELQGGAGTSCYVNHGTVHVDHVYPNGQQAANLQIKNNCNWVVDNWNYCKIFENAANAYAKVGSLFMSDGEGGEDLGTWLALDVASRFEVVTETKLNGTLINGPTSGDYAYVELAKITFLNVGETYPISNNINIYVSGFGGDNPTGFQTSFNTNVNASGNGNVNVVAQKSINTVSTEDSDCAPGFEPNDPVVIVEGKPIYSYAFEDMELGDYDLNDVVLQVQEVASGDNAGKLQLKLVAAGATLDNYIYFNNQVVTFENGESEIHLALGVAKGTMVNTGTGATATPVVAYVDKPTGAVMNQLPIELHPAGQPVVTIATTGQDPHGIVVPGKWKWPRERVCIVKAYTGFATFAEDVSNEDAADWYGTYVEGQVY